MQDETGHNDMKIFGDSISGNCLKVKYTADLLGLDSQWHEVNILKGASRTPEFLQINPHGQVPAVQFDNGETLAQSNAIIRYLANGTHLLPSEPLAAAKVDEWLFWEQYSHEPYVAVCRFQMRYLNRSKEELEDWRVSCGDEALDYMEQYLANHKWLANDSFSIADIALHAYTNMAEEGGFDLTVRPNLIRWLADCQTEINSAGN